METEIAQHQTRIKILKALADETRLEILSNLRHREELCGCELEKYFSKSQSTLSRHLTKLLEANLIVARKEGVKIFYKLKDPRIFKILAGLDQIPKAA